MEITGGGVRAIAEGVHWLGGCNARDYGGTVMHAHMSTYLVAGDERTLLIDTGHPSHWDAVRDELDEALAGRGLDIIVPTHPELPHSGNLARLLDRYPGCQVHGDVRDYHLYYPEHADAGRFVDVPAGSSIALGGTAVVILEGLLVDMPSTVWAYDTRSGCLFVSDGFGYAHRHEVGDCRRTSSEYDPRPSRRQTMAINETALIWTRFVDVDDYWPGIEALFAAYPPRVIAPAHGGVIDDAQAFVPVLKEGLEAVRAEELEVRASRPDAAVGRTMGGAR